MASVIFCPMIFKQPERAQQYDEDLQEIMKFDDQVWILEMSQAHFPNIIADAEATEYFVKIDFSKIKKDEFTAKVPPPGYITLATPNQKLRKNIRHFYPWVKETTK